MNKRRKKSTSEEPELGPAYRVRRDGALCAALVNTSSAKRRARGADPLATWDGLLAWGKECGVLGPGDAERRDRPPGGTEGGIAQRAAEIPDYAAVALHRVADLRLLVERILLALASHQDPDPSDLDALNAELARANRLLVRTGGGYRWVWSPRDDDDLGRLLLPFVVSIAEVLASEGRHLVRQCGGKDCDLLFVDRSAGGQRRWCSQATCGQRARARRRYHSTLKPRRDERRKRWRSRSPSSVRPPQDPAP